MGDTTVNYVIVGVIILIIIFVYFKYYEIKNKKDFIQKMKRQWRNIPIRDYTYEQLEGIKRYFLNKNKDKFYIDDITWNDLDMDSVFKLLNHTNSSMGEQYLYYILRTPRFSKEELEERKRVIDYLEKNEEARIKLQCMYGEIGRTGNYSLTDYIYNLADLDMKSNLSEFGMLFLGLASIIAALTIPAYGVLIFIGVLILNVSQYYRRKGEVEPYFLSISYINRLLIGADTFVKVLPEEFAEYAKRAKEAKGQFKKFRRHAKWAKGGKKATGSFEEIAADYVKMFFHIDLIKFNYMLQEVKEKVAYIDELIEAMGSIEAYIAIASFRGVREDYVIPELIHDDEVLFEVEEVYHPMISEPVVNSIKEDRSVLITGSNASGKSTFLKTAAINAILAQTIYMTMAKKYKANYYRVFSSMALTDNLMSNESYYIVEIKSLKRILDAGKEEFPILCFIDEVLRGTNTIERIAASAQILKSLSHENVLCFAATHDIELTHILEKIYCNYHFEEEVKDNDILFNYELKNGRATSRNAIKLLNIIGYDKQIIEQAESAAASFAENNSWRKLS
jgi:DNA mismatch repair ATPase MutS